MAAVSAINWIVWILSLIGNIYLAKKKNRSVAAWVVLSIFFSWIALIINACMKPKDPSGNTGGASSGNFSGNTSDNVSPGGIVVNNYAYQGGNGGQPGNAYAAPGGVNNQPGGGYSYSNETEPVDNGMSSVGMSSGGRVRGVSGVMMGQSYPVGGGLSIGRDVSSGLRFPNETKGISRNHCRIYPDGTGGFLIMDCGSSFGTFLKGYGKLSAQKPVPIRPGDTFYLGNGNEGFVFEQ
ncbi:MAG: FHA domain-containing protein [Lachnospiraceae bacterium]|nr:FHA domain-containing protein [Lachnospiraceae bacterium]